MDSIYKEAWILINLLKFTMNCYLMELLETLQFNLYVNNDNGL